MRICVSAIFFYNETISQTFLDNIRKGVAYHLEKEPQDLIHLTLTNNAFDKPINSSFHLILRDDNRHNFEVRIINNAWNKGYGLAHNEAFKRSDSDVFIILNNDLTFQTDDWISQFCAEIAKGKALVGLRNAPNALTETGEGYVSTAAHYDYAEGSALAVDSSLAKLYGLFAEDIKTAYFEDSDLSLRFRQLGHSIELVDIPHSHLRGVSTEKFSPATLRTIRDNNKSRFLSRWGGYLRKRSFSGKNLIILDCVGLGDVICSMPAVLNLCQSHAHVNFDLALELGHLAFLFEGIQNLKAFPMTSLRSLNRETLQQDYDRIAVFSETRCTSTNYLGREIAATMGVDFSPNLARQQISHLAKNTKVSDYLQKEISSDRLAVVHVEYLRTEFQGRGLSAETIKHLLDELKRRKYSIVNVGSDSGYLERIGCAAAVSTDLAGQITIPELIHVISKATLFVGIDSGPLHLAQYLNIPTFAIFGATSPIARILDWNFSGVHMQWVLDCLGCYHLAANSFVPNRCVRLDEACVKKIAVTDVVDKLGKFLDSGKSGLADALSLSQTIDARLAERELRLGNATKINDLERSLAAYESGASVLMSSVKRFIKRIPGARRMYVWLRSRTK